MYKNEIDLTFGLDLLKILHSQTTATIKTNGTRGDWFEAYAFSDNNNVSSNIGVGLKLFSFLGIEVNVEEVGVGASVSINIGDNSVYVRANANLLDSAALSVGVINTLSDNTEVDNQYSVEINTLLLAAVAIYFVTGGAIDYSQSTNPTPPPIPAPAH